VAPDATYQTLHDMAVALGYGGINDLLEDQSHQRSELARLGEELRVEREDRQNREVASRFLAENPDFPNTQSAIDALDQVLANNGLQYTSENMNLAHTWAIKNRVYQPLSQEQQQAALGLPVHSQRPTPPPMLRSGSPDSSTQGYDPHAISMEQLRKDAIRQQLEGRTPSLQYR